MKVENLTSRGKGAQKLDEIVKEVVVEEQQRRYEGHGYSYERMRAKTTPTDGQSMSDYGTLKAKPGDQMRLNMALQSSRSKQKVVSQKGTLFTPPAKKGVDTGHVGPYLLSGSNRSSVDNSIGQQRGQQETTVDVGDEFVLAQEFYDSPLENQKNYDVTLRIGEEKKKY